jgi:hypothetical protein
LGSAYAKNGKAVVDPAPSGGSTQESYTNGHSTLSMPGQNGTVEQTQHGNRQELNFDPQGSEVTGSDHRDTTVIYENSDQ